MFRVAADALPRAGRAFHDRVNRFEMAWVGCQTNLDLLTRREFAHAAVAEMIFHVAIAGDQIGNVVLAEFGEDELKRFAQEICEHVKAAAVSHAHADFLDADARTFVQDGVQNHHQRFGALKRKALLPDVTGVQKNLESFRFEQRPQQRHLDLSLRLAFVLARFQPMAHPVANPRVLDVHELGAD